MCTKENPYDFQVGDRVFDIEEPDYVFTIQEIDPTRKEYQIITTLGSYSMDGKYNKDEGRSLYHEGTEIIIKEKKPERSKWVNVYFPINSPPYISEVVYYTEKDARIGRASGTSATTIELKPN